MKYINEQFDEERALYNIDGLELEGCRFEGVRDGESAIKECNNVVVNRCFMDLRYPVWHTKNIILNAVQTTEGCRAAIWYSDNVTIKDSKLMGVKAVRECNNVGIYNSEIESKEFGWKTNGLVIDNSSIKSEYIFMLSSNMKAYNSRFFGKYGFQYMTDVYFENCEFDTKDAFWHGRNIVVKDCVVKGEYLGWYSDGLTFINCRIIGIQPLCYCKNLKLINCQMIDCNLSFEYSEVTATIDGNIDSIKNPKAGEIVCDGYGEVIITEDSKYECDCRIIRR